MYRFTPLLMLALCAGGCAQNVTWVSMQESQEHAFSMDVPKGWKVNGGIVHFALFEARMWVDMTSPDGKIDIRFGDPEVPHSYSIPNRFADHYGAPEGKMAINKVMMLRYEGGEAFADLYGQGRFAKTCANLETKELKVLPAIHTSPAAGSRSDAGQAIFKCVINGQEMGGYVVAETIYTPQPQLPNAPKMANWYLTGLGSFIAPKEKTDEVYKMFWHSVASFRINPEWWAAAMRVVNAGASAINAAGMKQMQASSEHFRQQSAERAKESDDFNHVLMGQTVQVDPATGQQREVATGPWSTYWTNTSTGQTVSSAMSPGPAFHEMQPAQ